MPELKQTELSLWDPAIKDNLMTKAVNLILKTGVISN